MSAADFLGMTEDERRAFAESFERAHANGEVSDRVFARGRIEAAIARWHMQAWEDAGRPELVPDDLMEGRPPIECVGIEAIDAALPHVTKPVYVFLAALAYLMKESDDALGIADKRAENCDKAAALLREAAELLRGADNEPLAGLVEQVAPWAERGKYGRVFPIRWNGHLYAEQAADALSASSGGKAGRPTRDAAIVRILASYFPARQEFFTAGGYALIGRVAVICGATKATSSAYVRSVIEQARRTAPQPAKAAKENKKKKK
jgi:hypothetical protein